MKSFEIHDSVDHITEAAVEKSATSKVLAGTILMVTRSGILRHSFPVAVAKREVTLNQDLKALTAYEGIASAFVAYCLLCFGQRILHECAKDGTTVQSIDSLALKSFAIPLAPFPEQLRIIAVLDELLSDLDAGVAALHQARAKLERFRASVLKAAVEGQLTAVWRERNPSTESAPKLLQRILTERRRLWEEEQLRKFAEKGKKPPTGWRERYEEPTRPQVASLPTLPKGWCWTTWSQLGFSQNGKPFPSEDYRSYGVRLLRPGNLRPNGRLSWNERNTRYLPQNYSEDFPSLMVGENELVMNLTAQSLKDEFLGRTCLTGKDELCLLNQRLARLKPILALPAFILWVFKSARFREFVDRLHSGSLIQHMFTHQLDAFTFPLPPLAEQQAIVEVAEDQLSVIDHLEADIEAKLLAAQSLRQAILHRAFSGQLVAQDPDDEPAEKLLARIAKERKAQEAQRAVAKAKRPRKRAESR
jgi:type I restriction enzyme, S subunit